MSDSITSDSEESSPVQPQYGNMVPVGGMKPGQLASIEISTWLMIKEAE